MYALSRHLLTTFTLIIALAAVSTAAGADFCDDVLAALGKSSDLSALRGKPIQDSNIPFPGIPMSIDDPCTVEESDDGEYYLSCDIVTTRKKDVALEAYTNFKTYLTNICPLDSDATFREMKLMDYPGLSFSHKGETERGMLIIMETSQLTAGLEAVPAWVVNLTIRKGEE
ncbi:hypothetical protein NKI82_05585 [Mesorhizobium sp. M0482]|uniref:hypothetical protein n=1 Tax=Mesorhizobium sp. M0482 TaxID=2956948 RepID=UPI003338D5F3